MFNTKYICPEINLLFFFTVLDVSDSMWLIVDGFGSSLRMKVE